MLRDLPIRWMALLVLMGSVWLVSASASVAATECSRFYGATAKASVASILSARFGEAFTAFDLDYPGMVDLLPGREGIQHYMETASGKAKFNPGDFTWLAFRRTGATETETLNLPHDIIVAFRPCSDKAVGFVVLR